MIKSESKITIQMDKEIIDQIVKDEVKNRLEQQFELNKFFYTMKDLRFMTGLSEASIYKYMFPDPRLPKRKIGNKWLFKVNEMNDFLNIWIDQFPND